MAEISFEIDVARIGTTYGLTLCLHEEDSSEEDDPCFFMAFEGPPDRDPVETAKLFMVEHQNAMESVGLDGEMNEEVFAEKLENSIVLAGELMAQYGFESRVLTEMDETLVTALFADEPIDDPKLLN